MPRPARHWLTPLILAGLLLAARSVDAQPAASQHTLVLDPSFFHLGSQPFGNHPFGSDLTPCSVPESPPMAGYAHYVRVDWAGDDYANCVYEAAVRFDLGPVHQFPGAVITHATLTYDDNVISLRRGDGTPAGDPYDLNQDAVWGSCVAQVAVPNDDWRGQTGLMAYTVDETIQRLDRATWDVTNQATHWYFEPDYLNNGLMLLGYDEGTNFSNDAWCVSGVSNFKLTVDFVANDRTPTPTPVTFHRSTGAGLLIPTPTPPANLSVGPQLPDLVVTGVDTSSVLPSGLVQVVCDAGRSLTFAVHVKNVGRAAADAAVVSLTVDGVPIATAPVDPLPPGAEKTVSITGLTLGAGNHAFTATVNPGQKFAELDTSNNSFTNDHLACA